LNLKTGNRNSSVGIATGYGVADHLIVPEYIGAGPQNILKSESYVRGGEGFENRNVVIKFSVITIQQNLIFLPAYILYESPLLPGIWNRSSNTKK
jgi:hypothetical protein